MAFATVGQEKEERKSRLKYAANPGNSPSPDSGRLAFKSRAQDDNEFLTSGLGNVKSIFIGKDLDPLAA
jgi:hypothetical protein